MMLHGTQTPGSLVDLERIRQVELSDLNLRGRTLGRRTAARPHTCLSRPEVSRQSDATVETVRPSTESPFLLYPPLIVLWEARD